MVWSVDIVLWLVVQILQYPSVLHLQGTCTRFISHPPHRSYESYQCRVWLVTLWWSRGGHFVKMVHNGVEYGIMQLRLKSLISCIEAVLVNYVKEGDLEVAPMENPKDYYYDIDTA